MPSMMENGLATSLKGQGVKIPKPSRVWDGPCNGGPKGGVTQSLLGKFLICRDRFRVRVIEGLDAVDSFNHRLGYGNMWHVCEEYNHKGKDWLKPLQDYVRKLKDTYRTAHTDIDHWYEICKRQFPAYLAYWKKQKGAGKRESVMQEQVFCIPYELPFSGRVVYLKGKLDGGHILSGIRKPLPGLYLDENKTKADIDEQMLQTQLTFDLQTMFYMTVFSLISPKVLNIIGKIPPLRGVRYNVIRRPLGGGKGSIKQKKGTKKQKPETKQQFYDRLLKEHISASPAHFFMRWTVEIQPHEIQTFRSVFLDPVLEQLCDWWQCQNGQQCNPMSNHYQNYRFPYGVYNPLTEGKPTAYDEYLRMGSTTGLRRNAPLFQELQ